MAKAAAKTTKRTKRPANRKKRSARKTATSPSVRRQGRPKRVLNCVPSKDKQDDWTFENAIAANILRRTRVPASKDLREDAWWKIGDQGSTGSCVGWAAADSVIRWHMVKAGLLPKASKSLLSPRFIWMAAKETDEFTSPPTTFIEWDGTSLKSALDVARKYGCVTDDVLPFASGKLYEGETKTFYAFAAQRKIEGYINIGLNPQDWREWLATKGPILTRLDCDSTWMNADYTNGVLAAYQPTTASGGHAVAMVGYDQNMFIIRNSWGVGWGHKGYAYASNAYAAAAFTECYGVAGV